MEEEITEAVVVTRRYLKYEYSSKNTFTTAKKANLLDEEGNLLRGVSLVEIGNIVLTPAVLNEEGEVISEAIMTGKYAVDILWEDSTNPAITKMATKEIYPKPCGVHTFGGLTYLYELEYYNKYPELKPIEEV